MSAAIQRGYRWYAASMCGRVPDARRLWPAAAAVVVATDVTPSAARDPCGGRLPCPSLLNSSLEGYLRLQSTQPSRIYSTINQQGARQLRRKPRANDAAWQVARLTRKTAARPRTLGEEAAMVKRMGVSEPSRREKRDATSPAFCSLKASCHQAAHQALASDAIRLAPPLADTHRLHARVHICTYSI